MRVRENVSLPVLIRLHPDFRSVPLLPANGMFSLVFFVFFEKKAGKCIFFLFFFRFRLSFFKIGVMFTVRVFAIRQERSHITYWNLL